MCVSCVVCESQAWLGLVMLKYVGRWVRGVGPRAARLGILFGGGGFFWVGGWMGGCLDALMPFCRLNLRYLANESSRVVLLCFALFIYWKEDVLLIE